MANRTFSQDNYALIHREIRLYTSFSVSEAVTPVPTLLRWNYPTLGVGVNARTYTAAATATATPSGGAPYPLQYQAGAEGVLSIVRTAVGKYTLQLQDNYQRLVDLNAYASVASGTPVFAIVTENTTISNYAGVAVARTGSLIGLAFWDFAAAAVDPIGVVRLSLTLADATEP